MLILDTEFQEIILYREKSDQGWTFMIDDEYLVFFYHAKYGSCACRRKFELLAVQRCILCKVSH